MQHTFTMLVFLLYRKRRKQQGEANEKATLRLGLWAEKTTSHPSHFFSLIRKRKILFVPFSERIPHFLFCDPASSSYC